VARQCPYHASRTPRRALQLASQTAVSNWTLSRTWLACRAETYLIPLVTSKVSTIITAVRNDRSNIPYMVFWFAVTCRPATKPPRSSSEELNEGRQHHTTRPSRPVHQHPARSLPKKRRRCPSAAWPTRRPRQGHRRSRAAVPGLSNVLGDRDHRAKRLPAGDGSTVPRRRGPDPGAGGGHAGAAAAPCVLHSGRRPVPAAPSCRSVPPAPDVAMLAPSILRQSRSPP
jgi:hypothetical protein